MMSAPIQPVFHAKANADEPKALAVANVYLDPAFQAAVTSARYLYSGHDIKLEDLCQALTLQGEAVSRGDMRRAEAMLTAQAHTLDLMFHNLAQKAGRAQHIDVIDKCLKLALRAQSQSRATWETLSVIKNPPIAGYVKQANFSVGHQQVNNFDGNTRTHTRKNKNPQNELLEVEHGERLDGRTTSQASAVDPAMATVESFNRPHNTSR